MENSTILITGGTGSFGQSAVRSVLRNDSFSEVRVLSRDECKQEEMRSRFGDSRVKFYIGDIRDRNSVDTAMDGVDVVFHAAALKQVPSCEFFPMQAVATNINGSHNVIESAVANEVSSIVCLGTDKAVAPINAMGMTKALMEKVSQSVARRLGNDNVATTLSSVRYGNVMCSRGSVIPLFVQKILDGEPLTITDPHMTRFMLPLTDSFELVEFAVANAKQGDVFVKKAPACTVEVLAKALMELFDREVPIHIIGRRHGEKTHETLISQEEMARTQDLGDFFRISMDARDLNYSLYENVGDDSIAEAEEYNSENSERLDVNGTKELLASLSEIKEKLEEVS